MKESEDEADQGPIQGNVEVRGKRQVTRGGVDMRHNMAAAQAAAKSVDGKATGGDEVKMVPASTWISMAPPGTATVTEIG